MFDFGNKKLIEDLKREVKFQNNLVGVGLAIQDELKKKNEILEKEKIEYQKTVEYLTNKIDELNDKIKELEKLLLEKEEKNKELYKYWDEAREYNLGIIQCGFVSKYNKKYIFEIEDIEYVEISDFIKKINFETIYKNDTLKVSSFLNNNKMFNDNDIKAMIKRKKIPMYNGIPFRKVQDLYRVMRYLESEKNADYKNEVNYIDFTNKIIFKNKTFYFNDIEINNNNINFTIEVKDKLIDFHNVDIVTYRTRNILIFNNKEFKSVKELKKLIKEKCYKDKELLKQFL